MGWPSFFVRQWGQKGREAMENYYQQPQQFYGGYQRQMQQATPGYVCKPVTSREEAIATSTDYFSLGVVMPDIGHGMIYLKRFNQQTGASDFFDFKLFTPEQAPAVEYATKADLDALRAELTAKKRRRVEDDDE